jgi:signal transduction histidine kinase
VSPFRLPTDPDRPRAVLNRLTLGFLDDATERDFRAQRAEASRALLRRFIVFMVVLVAFVTTGIRHKLAVARAAGLPVPPQFDMAGEALAVAAALALVLFLATLSRRLTPYLHSITVVCMAGLVLVDTSHSSQLPMAYALYGTMLNLVVLYVASQLRFAYASALGVVSTLMYLCCAAARNAPGLEHDPQVQLQMGVAVTLLACANLLLMFVTHQRELLARLAYDRARLLEQRGCELEQALLSLKQAEAQLVEQEKQATVGRLVAGILHEMNTPLGALSSATQTLARGLQRVRASDGAAAANGESSPLRDTLDAATRLTAVQVASAERIREVVEGLKQFVPSEHANLQMADLKSGLETAAAMIRPSLPAGVRLSLELPEGPIWVRCFPAKLNQAFLNLLKNAAAAFDAGTEQGGPVSGQIVVSVRQLEGRLRIEIRDTGCGIESERLPHIFDLDFSRQGTRVKLRLGLPASRGVVEAIGGTLTLESEVGWGSSAIIELPLEGGLAAAAAVAPASEPPAPISGGSQPVLPSLGGPGGPRVVPSV